MKVVDLKTGDVIEHSKIFTDEQWNRSYLFPAAFYVDETIIDALVEVFPGDGRHLAAAIDANFHGEYRCLNNPMDRSFDESEKR